MVDYERAAGLVDDLIDDMFDQLEYRRPAGMKPSDIAVALKPFDLDFAWKEWWKKSGDTYE